MRQTTVGNTEPYSKNMRRSNVTLINKSLLSPNINKHRTTASDLHPISGFRAVSCSEWELTFYGCKNVACHSSQREIWCSF